MKAKILDLLNEGDTIVSDSDGVLFDFNAEENAVERFAKEKGFFKNLQPIVENVGALRKLIGYGVKVKVLSASPNEQADRDKLECFAKYIPELPREDIILCRNTDNKADFIENIEGAILIDDYTNNLIQWRNAGGLVIKYLGKNDSPIGKHTAHNIPHIESLAELL